MITLYGFTSRSRAERVLWALRELELPHEIIRLDYLKGETRTEAFQALNPSGKVPVLVHDDKVLTESIAIIQYLDSLSEVHTLIPKEPWHRYQFDHHMMFLLTEVEPYLWTADQATYLPDIYTWPDGTRECAIKQFNENTSTVESWLAEHCYMAGEQFSAVDILGYHLFSWATLYDYTPNRVIKQYLSTLEQRAAFPEMMAGPDSPAKDI